MPDQIGFDVRFEWGAQGAQRVGRDARVIIVVDVLRFTSAVEVAVSHGAIVYPYRWRDESAQQFAASVGALVAGLRENATPGNPFSLSPLSMSRARPGTKIVLPSPNGAEVSLAAVAQGAQVLAGCLRNAAAVAAAALSIGPPIAVIAAGERQRRNPALRTAFEDQVGAGAILDALAPLTPSPEASAAATAFRQSRGHLHRALLDCASGRELERLGFADDVACSAEIDASVAVPHLCDGAFV